MSLSNELHAAILHCDFAEVTRLVEAGADVNALDQRQLERPISAVICNFDDLSLRHEAVSFLLSAGANPMLLDDEGERLGPLFEAVLRQDSGTIELLLHSGANPNNELGTCGESLLDYAVFDYCYERGWINKFPEEPVPSDRLTLEAWLVFLDRMAVKYNHPRPTHLRLLRSAGAHTHAEMNPSNSSPAQT